MRTSEDRSGPLVTCTGNTGRSPVLTGELVPVDWHECVPQLSIFPVKGYMIHLNHGFILIVLI